MKISLGKVTGRGVKSCEIGYQLGEYGHIAPQGTWSATIPSITKGQFLWTRTVFVFDDGDSATTYSVGYCGDGVKARLNGSTLHLES